MVTLIAGFGLLARLAAAARADDPPAKANFVLDKTLEGHIGKVWCVGFSPDGKVLASGSNPYFRNQAELKLWDVATGEVQATLAEQGAVRWVAFSPDGKHLATAEHNGTAKLRDPASGETVHELAGHASGLDCVVFSPDSATVATTSWDRTIMLWDVKTGELRKTLAGHPDKVYTAAISPDGKSLVSGSNDGTIRMWDVENASTRFTLTAHDTLVHNVAFAPGGKYFATAGWDKLIRFFDTESGKRLRTLEGHTTGVLAIAFSPDGKLLASVGMKVDDKDLSPDETGRADVKLWDTETGKELATLNGHTDHIYGVAFSPDGKLLATA
ncbi:MAG TPA: WD40 repeat domain-containing protein, partial [Planctomycetaceae bacterium]